jgi:hypothetical protein
MFNSLKNSIKSIPKEYQKIAENLFPSESTKGKGVDLKAAEKFAEVLGIGADYRHLLDLDKNDKETHIFLGHFQNNLDLLIQKTWVEKDDVARKDKLQDRIPDFIDVIEKGNFDQSLIEFAGILEELAWLMFGAQSTKEDFTEYSFRIDTQMGLFWWYVENLAEIKQAESTKTSIASNGELKEAHSLWAILLIGICFLTNF